jgi:hypothetical protein
MNANPSFVGQVLLTGGVLEMGARTIASSADLPIVATDQNLNVTAAQDLTITLPLPAALGTESGSRKLRFFDGAGVWGAHPVTFVASGGALIDGQPQVTISQPWGSVEFEWRGTYWHATGLNTSFGGFTGAVTVDAPPETANAADDEFNAATLGDEWAVFGSTVDPAAPARGATFAGPAQVRLSQAVRTGWLMIQPSSDSTPATIHRSLGAPMTQGMVYAKFSMDSNASIGPDIFTFALTQSSAGNPDFNNAVFLELRRSVADNQWTLTAGHNMAGVPTTIYTTTVTLPFQPVSRVQITRNGTRFDVYAGSSPGGMKFLGTFTSGALNPDRIAISVSNFDYATTIYGLDYVRRLDGVNPTV